MLFRVVVLNGPNSGQRITVSEFPMRLGRGPDCSLVLDDPDVARAHAEFRFEHGALHIVDLGTMTKTLVNQRAVHKTRLQHGDIIEVGRTRLLVEATVPAEVTEPGPRDDRSRKRRRRWTWAAAAAVLAAAIYALLPARETTLRASVDAEEVPPSSDDSLADGFEAYAPDSVSDPEPDVWVEDQVFFDVSAPSAADRDARLSEELRLLRGDLERIRAAVSVLAETREPTTPSLGSDEVSDPSADALQTLLERALAELDEGRLDDAARLLEGVQVLAPDFVPAWEVRARLFEQSGQLERAEQEWARVADLSAEEAEQRRARAEQDRVAQRRRAEDAASVSFLIASLHQRKFPERDGIREMRTVTVGLVPEDPHVQPDPTAVFVEVVFYERDLAEGRVFPSPRVAPVWLRPEGAWAAGEQKSLVATYRVDRLQPGNDLVEAVDVSTAYVGYRVRLFVRDELAAEVFRPVTLAYLPDTAEASMRAVP